MAFTTETYPNYLRGGVIFSSAYSDNAYTDASGHPVDDVSYSLWPAIGLDETVPRLHFGLTYCPGFTFYQRNSQLNQSNQDLAFNLQYRLSPHVTVSFQDAFQKTSSLLNQPSLSSLTPVYGSVQAPIVAVIAPTADVLSNNATAGITYQFSANEMVGVSGTFTSLHYPNPAQVPGLYDSSSMGGSAFYNRRVFGRHYIGTTYQYSRISSPSTGAQGQIQVQSGYVFYTMYLKPTLSVSISGGAQASNEAQVPLHTSRVWSPAGNGSLSWQGHRTIFAASYSRFVTAGGGLLGAFNSNSASASMRWQVTRAWLAATSANYSIYKDLPEFLSSSGSGGHTISGGASVQRRLGEHLNIQLGYMKLHQSYSDIEAISNAPATNREYISISYQFARPLGR